MKVQVCYYSMFLLNFNPLTFVSLKSHTDKKKATEFSGKFNVNYTMVIFVGNTFFW